MCVRLIKFCRALSGDSADSSLLIVTVAQVPLELVNSAEVDRAILSRNPSKELKMSTKVLANPLKDLQKFGQSVWLDYIRRNLITSGELQRSLTKTGSGA